MAGLEVLQSVQYVTVGEKRLAVIDMDDWEALLDWLETIEDTEVVREALDQLKAAGGTVSDPAGCIGSVSRRSHHELALTNEVPVFSRGNE